MKNLKRSSKNSHLRGTVNESIDIDICTNMFQSKLNECISKSFKKVRVTEKQNKELEDLFHKRKILRSKNDDKSKMELEDVENLLAEKCAEANYNKIKEE